MPKCPLGLCDTAIDGGTVKWYDTHIQSAIRCTKLDSIAKSCRILKIGVGSVEWVPSYGLASFYPGSDHLFRHPARACDSGWGLG